MTVSGLQLICICLFLCKCCLTFHYLYWLLLDHDYGCNNADRNFEHKYESAVAYVDFLGEPKDSLMAKRASDGHGVYGVKLFDFARPGGQELVADDDAGIDPDLGKNSTSSWKTSNKTVAVFVLDCRFHKTPWEQGHARYRPDYNGDFLGERQWQWFESAIRQSKASVNIVVNGLQVHPNLVPDGNVAESWSKYPVAQQRLFDAMLQEGVEAPILISGDVHMAQIMRKDCKLNSHNSGPSRPLMEMTTSGMTHSWGTIAKPLENPDEPPSIKTRFESFFAGSLMGLLHRICPWRDLLISSTETNVTTGLYENGGGEGAKTGKQFSLLKNFGELEFDWEARTVVARVIGENAVETPLLSAKWSLDQLSGRTNMPGSKLTIGDFEPTVNGKWTCLSHRGNASYVEHALGHAITGAVLVVILPFPFLVPLYVLFCLMRRGREKGPMLQSRSR
jgi:PhoD-like phosphatase